MKTTYKDVWKTLSAVNVNEHTESKGNLTYLSWAWAWGQLMEHFPQARYEFTQWEYPEGVMRDVLIYPDDSCSVECTIRIDELSRTMWLPVMDYKNNAIANPTARQISDNKMRCLTKCIGMLGLGHYIYAGEDLPSETKELKPKAKKKAPAVVKGEKKHSLREQNIDDIKKLIEHDAFDDSNKATILGFVSSINKDTPDEEITKWAVRMKDVTNKYDNKESK